MSDEGLSVVGQLVQRLESADSETRKFVQSEIAKAREHDRDMDRHEMRQRYIAQGITFTLPAGALLAALILGLDGRETAAGIIGGLDVAAIVLSQWNGIRRRP